MSGWGQGGGLTGDVTPAPLVGWERPETVPGLGVREVIGTGWRIYRRHFRSLLSLAIIPESARILTIVPSLVITARAVDAFEQFIRGFDVKAFRADPQGYDLIIERQLQAAVRPEFELAILSGIASGLAIIVGFVTAALLTWAALEIVDGRHPSIRGAFRAVNARGAPLILPAVGLGVLAALAATVPILGSAPVDSSAVAGQSAGSSVISLLVLILGVAVVVLAIRWSLVIPVILIEGLGLRAGLARSAALTSGVRIKIALSFLGYGLLFGLITAGIALVVAVAAGSATASLSVGAVGYFVVALLLGVIFAPVGSAMLAHIYRLRAPLAIDASVDGTVEATAETAEPPESSPTPDPPEAPALG
jgi:hypothetical protein